MKNKLFAFCALASLVFVACKKDVVNDSPMGLLKTGQGYRHDVKQKMYDISEDHAISLVQIFNGNANLREDGPDDDSIPVDSAIWIVEAALNYNLDAVDDENYEIETYSTAFDVAANEASALISDADADVAYAQLRDAIIAHTDAAHRVKVVDVEAYFISPGMMVFTAQAAVASIGLKHPCSDVPINGDFYLSSYTAMNNISPSLIACSAPATIDAPSLIQQKLNCMAYMAACANGGHSAYLNVSTDFISSGGNTQFNSYPNELWSNYLYNNCTWCNPPATVNRTLTDVQVNTYIANMKSYITGILPPTYSKISCFVTVLPFTGSGTQSCGTHRSWGWELKTIYGIRYCPGANPE